MKRVYVGKIYEYQPVGLDIWDNRHPDLKPGTLVKVCQPSGAPKNGVMGHCFIERADTGEFIGLVLCNSLQPAGGGKK